MKLNDFLNNPNLLPWLIPVGPLLAFFIITLITNRAQLVPGTSPEYADHNHPGYPGIGSTGSDALQPDRDDYRRHDWASAVAWYYQPEVVGPSLIWNGAFR